MNLYAYCLSEELEAATPLKEAGVGGARVRVMECVGLGVLVSEFGGERVDVTRENLRAHNEVLGDVLARTTPLPFRFGTLGSEIRLRNYVEMNQATLRATLERVRGCVEMSVKVLWDVEGVRREAEARHDAADAVSSAVAGKGSGAAYLLAKRRELAGGESLRVRAEGVAAWLAETLGETVRATRLRVRAEEALMLRAAHLVERARLEDYRARVQAASESRERDGLRFLTSGAWPPYSFSDVSA